MLNNELQLNLATTCIKTLATTPNSDEQIKLVLRELFSSLVSSPATEKNTTQKENPYGNKNSTRKENYLQFTQKEIKSMPSNYRKYFIVGEQVVFYRRKNNGVFEARFQRKTENIYIQVSSKSIVELKEKFLAELVACAKGTQTGKRRKTIHTTLFTDYAQQWLEAKQRVTKESTYLEYERQFKRDICPFFTDKFIVEVDRALVQKFLFKYVDENKMRTAQKLQLLLKCVFDLISTDFNVPSPMKNIELPYYEPKKGQALSFEEERKLVDYCIANKDNATADALLVLLYFGLRQSELSTITVNGEWLECTTAKTRKGRNEVKRKIPFTPMFRRVMQYVDFDKVRATNVAAVKSTIRRLFPDHHTHELRYTFITRAKECGVNPELVMIWDGHEFDKDVRTSKVDRGYTTYSVDYQLKEVQKITYEF